MDRGWRPRHELTRCGRLVRPAAQRTVLKSVTLIPVCLPEFPDDDVDVVRQAFDERRAGYDFRRQINRLSTDTKLRKATKYIPFENKFQIIGVRYFVLLFKFHIHDMKQVLWFVLRTSPLSMTERFFRTSG